MIGLFDGAANVVTTVGDGDGLLPEPLLPKVNT